MIRVIVTPLWTFAQWKGRLQRRPLFHTIVTSSRVNQRDFSKGCALLVIFIFSFQRTRFCFLPLLEFLLQLVVPSYFISGLNWPPFQSYTLLTWRSLTFVLFFLPSPLSCCLTFWIISPNCQLWVTAAVIPEKSACSKEDGWPLNDWIILFRSQNYLWNAQIIPLLFSIMLWEWEHHWHLLLSLSDLFNEILQNVKQLGSFYFSDFVVLTVYKIVFNHAFYWSGRRRISAQTTYDSWITQ